jgi:hypothetical protein
MGAHIGVHPKTQCGTGTATCEKKNAVILVVPPCFSVGPWGLASMIATPTPVLLDVESRAAPFEPYVNRLMSSNNDCSSGALEAEPFILDAAPKYAEESASKCA